MFVYRSIHVYVDIVILDVSATFILCFDCWPYFRIAGEVWRSYGRISCLSTALVQGYTPHFPMHGNDGNAPLCKTPIIGSNHNKYI